MKGDRDANVRRIAFVADALSRNGVHVLVAAVPLDGQIRDEVRASLSDRLVEVNVDTCLEETGSSDPQARPLAPELVLHTENESLEQSARRVLELLDERAAPTVAGPVGRHNGSVTF